MTNAALRRAIRAFSRRTPFRPYVIQFVSGDSLQISHPEAVALFRRVAVIIEPGRRHRLFDGSSVCQFLDVDDDSIPLNRE